MDFVTVSTGLILPYWMGLPIRYIQNGNVVYRTHVQSYGWLGWAKNGESSGSEGYSRRLEAIQICLVPKGQNAPGSINNRFYKK